MAYRPALLYLLSGLATIRVSTHTSPNTATCTEPRIPRSASLSHNVIYTTQRQEKNGANLGDEDAPEEGPDDVGKVQQHHVLEEQRGEGKLGDKVAQTLGLVLRDDVSPLGRSFEETTVNSSNQ